MRGQAAAAYFEALVKPPGEACMSGVLKLAIVGRGTILREALARILSEANFEITHVAPSFEPIPTGTQADILLMLIDRWEDDVLVPARRHFPDAGIVLLTRDFDFQDLSMAFQAGVSGYLLKDMSTERLMGSIRLVAMGEKVFPSELADQLTGQTLAGQQNDPVTIQSANLSVREAEILRCLALGLSNKEISRRLSISEATVKVHVKSVLRKLGVANRTQAAIWATSHGLVGGDREEIGQGPRKTVPSAPLFSHQDS